MKTAQRRRLRRIDPPPPNLEAIAVDGPCDIRSATYRDLYLRHLAIVGTRNTARGVEFLVLVDERFVWCPEVLTVAEFVERFEYPVILIAKDCPDRSERIVQFARSRLDLPTFDFAGN